MNGTGYISWPKGRRARPADGDGMWVYAYWLYEPVKDPVFVDALAKDPFVRCFGAEHTVQLPRPAMVASPNAPELYPPDREVRPVAPTDRDALHRGNYLRSTLDAGKPVLAAVCLGTTSRVFAHEDDAQRYWYASWADLTRAGRGLVARLSKLYGPRTTHLVTYVDLG